MVHLRLRYKRERGVSIVIMKTEAERISSLNCGIIPQLDEMYHARRINASQLSNQPTNCSLNDPSITALHRELKPAHHP